MDSAPGCADPWDVLLHDHRPPALVTCTGCGFTWHSASMARGLRIAGACVRCGGGLEFAGPAQTDAAEHDLEAMRGLEPHRALGRPEIG